MRLFKRVFSEFWTRVKRVLNEKRAEIKVSDLPPVKTVEVIIGGTAYLVSSFFKKDAKGDAVDKVRRLIERDTENLSEK